ncbi:MAG: site-specific integrase [Magnetococcales bacterium]|nr:site-specific integrase [Magnetococcales bacterium]
MANRVATRLIRGGEIWYNSSGGGRMLAASAYAAEAVMENPPPNLPTATPAAEMTLQVLLHRYLAEVSSKKSPVTHAQESRIVRHLTTRLGDVVLSELTPLTLTEFRVTRLQEAKAGTVARDLELLSQVIETAMTCWGVTWVGNPLNAVAEPMAMHGRGRQLKPGERLRLIAACGRHVNPLLGWVVRIILASGMRKAEVLHLQRSHVDLKKRVIHLPKVGSGAARAVPLTQEATKVLREALQHVQDVTDTPLIFFGEPGRFGRRRPYAIDRVLRQALNRARLKPFSCDELRDDAILRMREAGLTEEEVVAITGLHTLRIDRRAPHLQPDVLVRRLDELEL